MLFVQNILALIEPALKDNMTPSEHDFQEVCALLADGQFTYAYPYQMKELLIKFAKYVVLFTASNEDGKSVDINKV